MEHQIVTKVVSVVIDTKLDNIADSTLPEGMRQGLVEMANLSDKVEEKWVALATLAHDGGVYAAHITPNTEKNPNDQFDAPMYAEVGRYVAEGMQLGYLLVDASGNGISKESWKADALRFGAYDGATGKWNRCIKTLRQHLVKIETAMQETEARVLDDALAFLTKAVTECRTSILKMPVKRQDINVADASTILAEAVKQCKALKFGIAKTIKLT